MMGLTKVDVTDRLLVDEKAPWRVVTSVVAMADTMADQLVGKLALASAELLAPESAAMSAELMV